MKKTILKIIPVSILIISGYSCKHYPTEFCDYTIIRDSSNITKIAFGSCSKQDKSQEILSTVVSHNPDLFIYLGDNIYANTTDYDEMKGKYALMSCKSNFLNLANTTPIIATWDDHDYGENDAGEEFPAKEMSKELFLQFWQEPLTSNRYTHPGIYTSYFFGDSAHRVHIILLDLRTFRSPLAKNFVGEYIPNSDPSKTFLGNEQWIWLENELQQPSQLKFICTSTQICSEYNADENWSNFPLEQQKMFDLIESTNTEHVMFLSGDVHYSELSKRNISGSYPMYDFTSSGLTQVDPIPDGNSFRINNAVNEENFGLIEINWATQELNLKIINIDNEIKFNYMIPLGELEF